MSENTTAKEGTGLPPLTAGSHNRRIGIISVVVTFGGLLFGYDTGVINGALKPMTEQFGINAVGEGFITASLLLGAAIGAAAGGRLADRFGRKPTIQNLAVLFFISTLGTVFAPEIVVMVCARFFLGLAVGAASTLVPVYLSELAPTERRGVLSGRNEFAIVVGQLLAFTINAILASTLTFSWTWRVMLAVCAIPAVCLFIGMFKVPESPRWLVNQGRYEEALDVLMEVRNEDRARAELAAIKAESEAEASLEKAGFADLKTPWILRLVLIGVGLGICQQLPGHNSIMYYGSQVLEMAGFGHQAAVIANVANGVLAVVGTGLCFVLIDRFTRRQMILTGFALTTLMHICITATQWILPNGTPKAIITMIFMVLFIGCMQCFLNMPMWVLMSEIFPQRLRGLGMGLSVFALWIMNTIITFLFPILAEAFGLKGTFLMFAIIGFLAWFWLYRYAPETHGRSLEELEQSFKAGNYR